ncbi:MAG: hypothetical protein IPK07_33995 [Deltaproteobacteria bacterium]|nr:hypothetical protein [Deltaproteobacteria bacterium]
MRPSAAPDLDEPAAATSIRGRLVARADLTPGERQAMHGLLASYFDGVEARVFERDLANKNWVILLEDESGALRGFTTLHLYRERFEDEPITVVFSGDTIVDKSAWNTPALHRSWIDAVSRLAQREGEGRVWWFLIVSGFRTYRLLPVFFREFYPRHDAPTPGGVQRLMDHLASGRFGAEFDAATGIVRFRDGAQRLDPEVGEITKRASATRTCASSPSVTWVTKQATRWCACARFRSTT